MGRLWLAMLCLCACGARADIRVDASWADKGVVDEIRQLVDGTIRSFESRSGLEIDREEIDARVVVHGDAADFERADQSQNKGKYKRAGRFTNPRLMESHIAVQPPIAGPILDEVGLPLQTKSMIVSECVRLLIYHACRDHQRLPEWLAKGLGKAISNRLLHSDGSIRSYESEPRTSSEILWAQSAMNEHPGLGVTTVLESGLPYHRDPMTRYAIYASMYRWFEHLGVLDAVVADALGARWGAGARDEIIGRVLERLGPLTEGDPDGAFRAWTLGLEPEWNEFGRSLQSLGDGVMFHAAFPTNFGKCWTTEPLGEGPLAIAGEMRILDKGHNQLSIKVGEFGRDVLNITCQAGVGFSVFHRRKIDGEWESERVWATAAPSFEVGEWEPFRVGVSGDTLYLRIAQSDVYALDISGVDCSGVWGLGVHAGCAGFWRDVHIKR